jgi:tetratricopeptide (TPR) repeat protein
MLKASVKTEDIPVFGNDGSALRHLPFFEEVAAHEEHQAQWRAATAGLVTLRLVDAWIEEGPAVAAPDSWSVRAVLKAIDEMDEGSPIPSILHSVVSAMADAEGGTSHHVTTRLMAYARALEYEAQWRLASDVYETVIAHTHPVEESDSAVMAHIRYAVSLRMQGKLLEAQDAYATAGAIAQNVNDMIGVLQAQIGAAKVAVARGNLPHAEAVLDETIATASQMGIASVHSMALHDRAMVAGMRGRHDLAIELAYDALREAATPVERDRILSDIGTAFHMLGLRSVARDAFMVLSATAQEQYMRWVATLSLLSIAAEDGSEVVFNQMKRQVNTRQLPPELETDYYIRLGRAYRELNNDDLSQIALAKAVELAEHYGFAGLLFEAEAALHAPPRLVLPEPTSLPPGVAGVAEEVRHMRAAAVLAG